MISSPIQIVLRRLLPPVFLVSLAVMAGYFLVMAALWQIGIESIYAHPTPFYALFLPIFTRMTSPYEYLFLLGSPAIFLLYAGLLLRTSLPQAVAGMTPLPDRRETRRILVFTAGFLFSFACAVAMMRHGLNGISQAYGREAYEYVGDIGKTSGIRALFERYLEIRPYLSMHAKVHPPGPIAVLWALSYIVTPDRLALSLATALMGALAVFPLHGWLKACFGERVAIFGVMLYVLVPSVVLFDATSADIFFTPVTLAALWGFERSIRGGRAWFAIVGGVAYALATLLSFSLIGVGAYFAILGFFAFWQAETRVAAMRTAALMLAAFFAVHAAVWMWSGFDYVAAFRAAKAQFDLDQFHLDQMTPRYPGWTFRLFFNPAAWFYFAGIPISLLFLRGMSMRLRIETDPAIKGPPLTPTIMAFVLTAVALNFLYLARGEGERSALYLFPFMVGPAAVVLGGICGKEKSSRSLWGVLVFLAFQCWLTEALFYTYW